MLGETTSSRAWWLLCYKQWLRICCVVDFPSSVVTFPTLGDLLLSHMISLMRRPFSRRELKIIKSLAKTAYRHVRNPLLVINRCLFPPLRNIKFSFRLSPVRSATIPWKLVFKVVCVLVKGDIHSGGSYANKHESEERPIWNMWFEFSSSAATINPRKQIAKFHHNNYDLFSTRLTLLHIFAGSETKGRPETRVRGRDDVVKNHFIK